jgi:hypothetical protein
LDVADWHEAWNHYTVFLDTYHDAHSAKRWHDHYLFLAKQDNFKLNFSAILKFDIEQRNNHSLQLKQFNKDIYLCHFDAIKLEILQEQILANCNTIKHNTSIDRTLNTSRSDRFEPYDNTHTKGACKEFTTKQQRLSLISMRTTEVAPLWQPAQSSNA